MMYMVVFPGDEQYILNGISMEKTANIDALGHFYSAWLLMINNNNINDLICHCVYLNLWKAMLLQQDDSTVWFLSLL